MSENTDTNDRIALAEAVREACAKVCEDDAIKYERVSASRIAKLIRALDLSAFPPLR